MTKKETFWEYIRTILLTLIAVFIAILIMLAVIQHNVYERETERATNSATIEYYLVGVLIDKNKYLENKYPENYKINLKLGILYEIYKDFSKAEEQYLLAISKVPYHEYKPEYRLALLYIKMGRFEEAQKLMDDIIEKPDKTLIKYKAEIYTKLANQDYIDADYASAILKFEKTLTYLNALKSSKTKEIQNSIASCYVYLADEYISNMQIDEAINALNIADSIVDAPIIKYKLAILISATEPQQAAEYYEEVFKKEPGIINYEQYYNLLQELASSKLNQGNIAKSELYKYRAKKVKDYYDENILSIKDLSIDYIDGEIIQNNLLKKDKIILDLKLKNMSINDIKSLYLYIIFKDNGETFDKYEQKVFTTDTPLQSAMSSPIISIRAVKRQDPNKKVGEITAEISVSKSKDSYQIILSDVEIKATPKGKSFKYRFKIWLEDTKAALKKFFHLHR